MKSPRPRKKSRPFSIVEASKLLARDKRRIDKAKSHMLPEQMAKADRQVYGFLKMTARNYRKIHSWNDDTAGQVKQVEIGLKLWLRIRARFMEAYSISL